MSLVPNHKIFDVSMSTDCEFKVNVIIYVLQASVVNIITFMYLLLTL